jgi:hypothetical protein
MEAACDVALPAKPVKKSPAIIWRIAIVLLAGFLVADSTEVVLITAATSRAWSPRRQPKTPCISGLRFHEASLEGTLANSAQVGFLGSPRWSDRRGDWRRFANCAPLHLDYVYVPPRSTCAGGQMVRRRHVDFAATYASCRQNGRRTGTTLKRTTPSLFLVPS